MLHMCTYVHIYTYVYIHVCTCVPFTYVCVCTLHRIMRLKGRHLVLGKKQKSIREQTNSPKKYVYIHTDTCTYI